MACQSTAERPPRPRRPPLGRTPLAIGKLPLEVLGCGAGQDSCSVVERPQALIDGADGEAGASRASWDTTAAGLEWILRARYRIHVSTCMSSDAVGERGEIKVAVIDLADITTGRNTLLLSCRQRGGAVCTMEKCSNQG